MVWSEIGQREYDIPDFYGDATLWLPSVFDATVVVIAACLFTIARKLVQDYFLEDGKRRGVEEQLKYSESCWKTTYYAVSFILEGFFIYRGDFWPDTVNCWKNYPNIPMPLDYRIFYLFQVGFYVHSLIAHFVMEVKRSDWWILLFHHLVTLWLLWFSYALHVWKIGILVLFVHDANDIPLEAGKVCVYQDKQKRGKMYFALLIISWAVTRLYFFPYYVIHSTYVESITVVPYDVAPFYWVFNGALIFLLILHIYWYFLILKIAIASLTENQLEDKRETDFSKKKAN